MLTNNDLSILNLSPTNKDYYQVWSELIDTATKLSERWDPSSTNESDPGIVLLKVLTAIADKLNYNIDKNILEAFMPTASQAESMKRLCDMLGYHVGYYESATTDVTIRYVGDVSNTGSQANPERLPDGSDPEKGTGLVIPAFTVLYNEDKTIYYSTTKEVLLTNEETFVTVPCIEGQRILCETGNSKVIGLNNLDTNNRYYLPEIQIAENGIFVYGTVDGIQTTLWKKVNNLNVIPNDTKAYSFHFDSKENRPYIQFPSDIGQLIEDGLEIYYIRTSGAGGNISAKTLSAMEKPTFGAWADYTDNDKFVISNPNASLNGKNPENIEQAYNGFKKTIGTFDTLVTCRDYMNKIYQLVDDQNNELVSNIIVSDIRDDINRAHVLCSFSDYGIVYVEKANAEKPDTVVNSTLENQGIDHFDLVLYPFKAYQRLDNINDYKASFTYSDAKLPLVKAQLADIKTICHNFSTPVGKEIVCIKNYLKLNARISTVNKVNSAEETLILDNVKKALFRAFNMRELDFGEEIPYDSILKCMEQADPKIKGVILDEPFVYTRFAAANGKEYDVASVGTDTTGLDIYNKLTLRNILAGRIELFEYDTSFKVELGEALYPSGDYAPIYPIDGQELYYIETECKKNLDDQYNKFIPLNTNEVIKFRAPSLKTLTPYSAYVNYYLVLKDTNDIPAEAARFLKLEDMWIKPIEIGSTEKLPTAWTFGRSFYKFLEDRKLFETSSLKSFVSIDYTNPNTLISISGDRTTLQKSHDDAYSEVEKLKASEELDTEALKEAQEKYDTAQRELNTWDNLAVAAPRGCLYYKQNITDEFQLHYIAPESNTSKIPNNTTFADGYYRIIEIQNDDIALSALSEWAQLFGKYTDISQKTASDPEGFDAELTSGYKLAEGPRKAVYRSISASAERNPGKYVDRFRIKYMPATQPESSATSAWATYFWPAPRGCYGVNGLYWELKATGWTQVETSRGQFLPGFTVDSLGRDGVLSGIQANEDYQLKSGEYLYINYTPASTTATSEQATTATTEPLNICHGPGTIIRPSMALYNSYSYYHSGYHSWTKTTGFDFTAFPGGGDIEGMYSIGPSEQIDIRDFIEVTLKDPTYIYWILNEDISLASNKSGVDKTYTLKDGEYIFYTDKNKLDLAYCGVGTEIRLEGGGNRVFRFAKDVTQVNLEEVLLHGVSAIPWRMISVDNQNYLKFREFQYITLTEGDSIRGLVLNDDRDDKFIGKTYLDNEWTMVDDTSPCYYLFAGEKESAGGNLLPKITIRSSDNPNEKLGWEVRSFLELNMGPDEAQILNEGNSIKLIGKDGKTSLLYNIIDNGDGTFSTEDQVITPDKNLEAPLAIKSNYPWKSAGGKVSLYQNGSETEDIDESFKFRIKVFENSPIATISAETDPMSDIDIQNKNYDARFIKSFRNETRSEDLPLYNFNSLWTLVSAENFISKGLSYDSPDVYSWVRANTSVPDQHYNIMMLYYLAPESAYEFGQGMGFRFYTYKTTPTVELSGEVPNKVIFEGTTYNVPDATELEGIYRLESDAILKSTKDAQMIVDQDTITFTYSNTATSERFTDTYYYKFDYEDNSFKLFTDSSKADEYAVTPDDSTDHLAHTKNQKASIVLNKDETNKCCSIENAVYRGISFREVITPDNTADTRNSIIGNYTYTDENEENSFDVNITANKIVFKLPQATQNTILYYTYDAVADVVSIFEDAEHKKPIKSPLFGYVDTAEDGNLNLIYQQLVYTLTPQVQTENLILGLYDVNRFADTLVMDLEDGTAKFTTYNASANITNTDIYAYTRVPTGTAGANEQLALVSKNNSGESRFRLDENCQHVKLFNHLSVDSLKNFLDPNATEVLEFPSYFNALSWWTKKELGYTEDADSIAFGTKEIPSGKDLHTKKSDEDDTEETPSTTEYRLLSNVYFLKPGLNIIVFQESGKFEFFPEIDAGGALFLSDIDSIKNNTPNLGLDLDSIAYKYVDNASADTDRITNKTAYKLLLDIKEKDPNYEFYYNCPLQVATAIDINKNLIGDDKEDLSQAKFWYDVNNINNKFVISEIDADHLKTGLVISKASKLK